MSEGATNPQATVAIPVFLVEEIEVIGHQCLDTGKCHHRCTRVCARRHSLHCVPLSVAASYLNDDWTVKQ